MNSASERSKALRPRDAATLIILRGKGRDTQVLMGQRHAGHKFMPNKFVFPGGRVDPADCRYRPARDLHPQVAEKLLKAMRRQPSPARARGLAMAAVRETFEETGLIIGDPIDGHPVSRSQGWRAFAETGHVPRLDGLRYLARAITPPGRPRRFDTRFLVVAADQVRNIDDPVVTGSEELLQPHWLTIPDALTLDLPRITTIVLGQLRDLVTESQSVLATDAPVPFQYMLGKSWRHEVL